MYINNKQYKRVFGSLFRLERNKYCSTIMIKLIFTHSLNEIFLCLQANMYCYPVFFCFKITYLLTITFLIRGLSLNVNSNLPKSLYDVQWIQPAYLKKQRNSKFTIWQIRNSNIKINVQSPHHSRNFGLNYRMRIKY